MAAKIMTMVGVNGKVSKAYVFSPDIVDAPAGAKARIKSGSLPAGLNIVGLKIEGTPTAAGTFKFVFELVDEHDVALDEKEYSVTIDQADPVVDPAPGKPLSKTAKWAIGIGIFILLMALIGYLVGNGKKQLAPTATEAPTAEVTEAPTAEGTEAPNAEGTEAPTAEGTEAPTAEGTPVPTDTTAAAASDTTTVVSNADGKALAEEIWGEPLPDQPAAYVAGEDGYPLVCSGLCWDTSKINNGAMMWYGPTDGSEDITEADGDFGNGNPGPLDLMRTGEVTKVVFYLGKDGQLEVCALGTLDGTPLSDILGVNAGECGKRVAITAGWHVIQDNATSPIAGFGVRFTASGWAGMTEAQIVEYTGYWKISGDTATWAGPEGVEIMMVPSMVSMMQDIGTLKSIVFTTTQPGKVLFCNGNVTGAATLSSKDGSCQFFEVPVGTFTYHGEDRLSAGISWQPAN